MMQAAITAVILAGGQGLRMGGQDKGLLAYQGQAMVSHVIGALQGQVSQIMINANRHHSEYQAFGYPVISDTLSDYQGPLAGMQTGLQYCQTELCLFVPCDTPNLPKDLVSKLSDALLTQQVDITIARSQQVHPVICLMRVACLNSLEQFLAQGQRKVLDWQTSMSHCIVDFAAQSVQFNNLNTPQEWSA